MEPIDPDAAWIAFAERDRAADGRFVVGVASTGIYCRPSCPARRPRREGVSFFPNEGAAEEAGYRACRRCMPGTVTREATAVTAALAILNAAEAPLPLATLSAQVGYAPHHLQRLFTRAVGLSPAAYARARRAARAENMLEENGTVTNAIYKAGYQAASRFYADTAPRLGMAPSVRAKGGLGEAIRWTIADTSLGPLLIAATAKGLCRVAFDEDEAMLRARFPRAAIAPGDQALADLAARVVEAVEQPGAGINLPLDVQGTAFQERVWRALAAVPPGETVSYAQLAAAAGAPGATRAVGSACGANPVAVAIPCHRARRSDGGPGGYAWGLARKAALLERERG